MTVKLDEATLMRREKMVDQFVLVSVIDDSRPSVGTALEILWNANIRTIGDIRGRRLSKLFEGHSLTAPQQEHFAKTLHPFGVFLD